MNDEAELLAKIEDADADALTFLRYLEKRLERAQPESDEWVSLDFLVHHYRQLHKTTLQAIAFMKRSGSAQQETQATNAEKA